MKKIIFLSFSSMVLLTACGSQNLLPLEEKSTELQEDNHELKLTNQSLKNENAKKEKQLAALEKDTKNTKQAQTNHQIAQYYEVSSAYYSDVTSIINAYQALDKDVVKNDKKREVLGKLDAVIDDHDLAVERYKDDAEDFDVLKKDDNVKKKHKEVESLQQKIHQALETIRKGYAKKDEQMIQKGRQELVNIKVTSAEGTEQ
ncbi:hypothetical protein TP70_01900 [Staphylococcus microti]|uniref:Lipoprotein n=1 Tax=Staphylococcus microti TaxID=569857 RepID=A0A0D6XSJ1_9STAP|nr:hypothetical protein [Staphylococcus microti]KIX91567.1 hypothetical protein TP70_01900 [Staphylococcus microti]PNZ81024.1 hypothetical protein CD132_07090 [Staphylococcus microti]SUM57556.1 lipoprotein [Staphylococcus microti]